MLLGTKKIQEIGKSYQASFTCIPSLPATDAFSSSIFHLKKKSGIEKLFHKFVVHLHD